MNNTISRRQFMKDSAMAAAAVAGSAGVARLLGNDSPGRQKNRRPNILLIMADDMGYSDIGCFGGAIRTPHIDQLAGSGMKYTSFYNSARCCPARASLLTGLYPHQTGMGWQTAINMGRPAYQGSLNRQCRTIAEVLKPAGYGCYMSGKWHLSRGDEGLPDARPMSRGFDRFFGMIGGAGSYFNPKSARLGTEPAPCDPQTFYYTDAITDYACSFINEHHHNTPDKPFFSYVAYTAPHWPLHAKSEDIDRYRGQFVRGWDAMRQEKYERMLQLGILDKRWKLCARDDEVAAWESLSHKEKQAFDLRMAIYAAQVDCMDQGVGRIMDCLEQNGVTDDTLVLFLSDNGGCHEEIHWQTPSPELWGTKDSFESYGRGWANCSNTPFRMFKSWVHEGGISTPLIAHWPIGIATPGMINRQYGHISDIMPTCCELAGATYAAGGEDHVHELVGKSLAGTFKGGRHERKTIFWEHEGNRALRQDQWKLVATDVDGPWELYDMDADRTEMNNLAAHEPRRVEVMMKQWDEIARATDVYPMDGRKWKERIDAFKKKK